MTGDQRLRHLVGLAVRAPSFHNTQPWRFRSCGEAVEILADPARTLPVSDPSGWATRVAIGAAAFNLRLGYALLGWEARTEPFPHADQPEVLVRVCPTSRRPASPAEQSLAAVIGDRHTNRRPYLDHPVPGSAVAALVDAARAEAAWLTVGDPRLATDVAGLIAAADDELERRPGYRAERHQWSRGRDGSADGVSPDRLAGRPRPDERVRRRDFGAATGAAATGAAAHAYESDPCLAVLGTPAGTGFDDLRAGQALQRVLLRGTELRLTASMYSQPIESATVRERLSARCPAGVPQMVLRFGYGSPHPPAVRRRIDDVLVDDG